MSSGNLDVSSIIKTEELSRPRAGYARDLAFSSSENASAPPVPKEAEPKQAQPAQTQPQPTQAQLNDAVATLNQHFTIARSDLKFSVEQDTGVLVVSVVDANDGRVLMQIPTEQALRTAREVKRGLQGQSLIKVVA